MSVYLSATGAWEEAGTYIYEPVLISLTLWTHSPLPNLPLSLMLTFLFICLSHPLTVPLCFAPALFRLVFVLFLFIGLGVKVSLDKWGARERDILWHPIYVFGQILQLSMLSVHYSVLSPVTCWCGSCRLYPGEDVFQWYTRMSHNIMAQSQCPP